MRRLKRYIYTSMAAMGGLLLSGCAAESPEGPITAPDDSPFYLTFQLATPTAPGTGPVYAPATRAGENGSGDVAKRDDEFTVKSIVAYMVDAKEGENMGDIAGVAYGDDKVAIGNLTGSSTSRTRTITLNMGLNTLYTRQHPYRVYVLANIPDVESTNKALITGVVGKNISEIHAKAIQLSSTTILPGSGAGKIQDVGLPMSTTDTDAAKIQVWLEDGEDYSSTPYVVKAAADGTQDGVLELTPLYSRFDFVHGDGKSNFEYPIQYKAGEGASATTETEMYVEFKRARVGGAAEEVFTVLKSGSGDQTYISPTKKTFDPEYSSPFNIVHSESGSSVAGEDNPAIYVPEYIPTVGTGVTELKYKEVTYIELDAIIKLTADCKVSTEVLTAYNAHSDLGYYDDGKYQSTLMVWDGSRMDETKHWKKLTYNSLLGGYVVTYRHAIRHSNGSAGTWTETDGVVYPMEYGVVRNHLYQIGIKSVSSLPHPWTTNTPIESANKDINIQILPPKQWTYHRGGFNLTFE